MPWTCQPRKKQRNKEIQVEEGTTPSSVDSPMTPLQTSDDHAMYYDMDEFARAPEASGESIGESSFVSGSDDRKDRQGELDDFDSEMQRACDIAAAGEREIAALCDIAMAGARSRRNPLRKTKSEDDKMTTQIEIIFAKDQDSAAMLGGGGGGGTFDGIVVEDGDSETWLAEKCVEVVPGNI